jgi:hypothetical protein
VRPAALGYDCDLFHLLLEQQSLRWDLR